MKYLTLYSLIVLILANMVSCELTLPELNREPTLAKSDVFIVTTPPPYESFDMRQIIDEHRGFVDMDDMARTPLDELSLNRYTYDHTTVIASNEGTWAFPYGLNASNNTKLWQANDGYIHPDGNDLDPANGRAVDVKKEKDSIDIPDKPLKVELPVMQLWESYPDRESEKLLSYRPVFLDSVIYHRTFIEKPRYINENEIVFITYKRHYRTNGIGDTYDHNHDSLASPPWLMKWNRRTDKVDSLFAFPFTSSSGVEAFEYRSGWTLVTKDSLYLISEQGKVTFKTRGRGGVQLHHSGKVFANGGRYYNYDKDISVNLSNYIEGVSYTYPTDQKALVMKGEKKLYIFNVTTKNMSDTIHVDDIPEPEHDRKREENIFYIKYPLIDSQGTIKLFYINTYKNEQSD